MISFKPPVDGLAPNHYIEITKDSGGADGKRFTQPQRLLICLENDAQSFSKIGDSKEEKIIAAAIKCNRGVEAYYLKYKKDKLKEALKLLPEEQFTQIIIDKPTQANVNTLTGELDNRWKSDSQIDGHLFVVTTAKEKLNLDSIHATVINKEGSPEQENLIWAAAIASLNALHATEPSRPYSTLKVDGINSNFRSTLAERENLLKDGISTYKTNIQKNVFIDRLITTSKDPEYRSLEVKQTLSAVRYDLKNYFENRFKRHMLVKDNHPYGGAVLSPKSIKSLLVSRYRFWQSQNLVQDDGQVTQRIKVEVSAKNPTKVDVFLPLITMGQLLQTQTQIAFKV